MNTLGEWFRNAFPMDEVAAQQPPGQSDYRPTREEVAAYLVRAQSQAKQPIFAPTRDEFAAWRDDPVTQFVMRALKRNAEECREKWMEKSWDAGNADPNLLLAMRERHDALMGFTSHYDDFCAVLGLEQQEAERAA